MPTRYSQNPAVAVREEDASGALLFNPDTNQIKVLNETGLYIWKLCDGSRDLNQIVNAVKDAFDTMPDESVENEISAFLTHLLDTQLLGTVK
jgi:hypothetical protein